MALKIVVWLRGLEIVVFGSMALKLKFWLRGLEIVVWLRGLEIVVWLRGLKFLSSEPSNSLCFYNRLNKSYSSRCLTVPNAR